MYFKIALKNVKKSYKDFLIYFLTLAFSVCLFYTFNSFQAQQAVLDLNKNQLEIVKSITLIMGLLSNFVSIVLAFLILYANNFLIKRRKREFGLYMLLGMPKQSISKILVYETFIIGIISLIIGLGLGLLASQLLTVATASLFTATLNYEFVFSLSSTMITVFAFSVIFLVIMIFNAFIVNRYKLIDLINAGRKNEKLRIQNLWISVIIFIISLCFLGYAYYTALDKGMLFVESLSPIIISGSIGTVLFFLSLSGFLLKFIQTSKKLYYRKLNMFVLRQINAKINSNFLSMSVVCIMLLLSIGALSTGLTLRDTLNNSTTISVPFDNTVASSSPQFIKDVDQHFQDHPEIKDRNIIYTYEDQNLNAASVRPYSKSLQKIASDSLKKAVFEIIPLSSYNKNLKMIGKKPLSLKSNEAYYFTGLESMTKYINEVLSHDVQLTVFNQPVQVKNKKLTLQQLGTSSSGAYETCPMMAIVVPDTLIPSDATPQYTVLNYNLNKAKSSLPNKIVKYVNEVDLGPYGGLSFSAASKDDILESSAGTSVMFTYIGLYLGIVFLVASTVVLALQQLSEADDSRRRYQILRKIGAEKKMMNQAVFMQIGIYFFMPLALAIIHSYVGIKVVNSLLVFFGRTNILQSSLITGSIILLLYGAYFLLTYSSYNRIIQQDSEHSN